MRVAAFVGEVVGVAVDVPVAVGTVVAVSVAVAVGIEVAVSVGTVVDVLVAVSVGWAVNVSVASGVSAGVPVAGARAVSVGDAAGAGDASGGISAGVLAGGGVAAPPLLGVPVGETAVAIGVGVRDRKLGVAVGRAATVSPAAGVSLTCATSTRVGACGLAASASSSAAAIRMMSGSRGAIRIPRGSAE